MKPEEIFKLSRRGKKRGPSLRGKKYKNACGLCCQAVRWKDSTPFNVSNGTNHFTTCEYVSARKKKEILSGMANKTT